MWNRRICAIVLGAITVAGGLTGLGGCRRRPQPPAPAPEQPRPQPGVSGIAKGIRLRLDDAQGRPVYEVRSDASQQSQADPQATLTDTTVTLYHEGKPDVLVTAPNTKVKAETRELVMWGGVTAKAPRERATFRVERLTWNADTKVYLGTGGVAFAQPPLTMQAQRITGRTPIKTVNLEGGVTLNVVPSGEKP